MTRNLRIALIGAAVVAAVVAFVVLRSGGDDNGSSKTSAATGPARTAPGRPGTTARPSSPPIRLIRVKNAKAVGGIQDITVHKGDEVRFAVTSDVADQVHVHGYDILKPIRAGGSVTFSFPARIVGVFEIELEQRSQQIAELKVEP